MATSKRLLQEVQELKGSLSKALKVISSGTTSTSSSSISTNGTNKDDVVSTEQCLDMLKRLEEVPMTLSILTETLIGTVVSKLKHHDTLGPSAKSLVKKWKKLAKDETTGNSSSASATATTAKSATASSTKQQLLLQQEEEKLLQQQQEQHWDELPPLRKNICIKLHQLLTLERTAMLSNGMNDTAFDHLTLSRASEVEAAIQAKHTNNKSGYTEKARSLCFNIKKNSTLRRNIIMGSTPATDLVTMTSEQLSTAEDAEARNAEISRLQESRRLDWETANEGKINEMCGIKGDLLRASLFTCSRCKSTKTTSTQKQTRSADEPMTVFVLCINCGKRWKC